MEEREKRLEVWKHGMDHASLLSIINPNLLRLCVCDALHAAWVNQQPLARAPMP